MVEIKAAPATIKAPGRHHIISLAAKTKTLNSIQHLTIAPLWLLDHVVDFLIEAITPQESPGHYIGNG